MKTFITVYDTFQELCDDPDLTESMVVMTLGDVNIDDGKGATYKIISEKANGNDTLPIRRGLNPLSARIISSYSIPKNIKSVHTISSTVNAIGDSVNLSYEKTDEIHNDIIDVKKHVIEVINNDVPNIEKNISSIKSNVSDLTEDMDTAASTNGDAIDILMDMISGKRISNILEIRNDFKFVNTFAGDTYAISDKYGTDISIEVTIDKIDIENNPWVVPIEFILNTKVTTIQKDYYTVTYNRDNNIIFTFDLSKSDTGIIKL